MLLLGALVATLGVLPPAASARSWAEFPRGGASHEYSHSLTTFSPEVSRRVKGRPLACTRAHSPHTNTQGELLQLEHALAAANEAPSSLGLVGEGCVVLLGLEPEMPPLLESGTPRAMVVNENTVAVYAGLAPDARVLAEHAQDEGVAHEAELGEPIPPAALARAVAEKMQEATQQGGTRPFGASLIIGSCTGAANAAKPCLFQVATIAAITTSTSTALAALAAALPPPLSSPPTSTAGVAAAASVSRWSHRGGTVKCTPRRLEPTLSSSESDLPRAGNQI